jgi:hypothetical protein
MRFLHFRCLQILQYFCNDVWIGSKVATETINVCLLFGSPKSISLEANMNKADLHDFVCRINQEPIIMLIVVIAGNFHHVGCCVWSKCVCRVGCGPVSILNLNLPLTSK